MEGVPVNGKVTRGIQTMYRDGSTQTDPYTPDYVLNPEEPEPEVLAIAHMQPGENLPPGRAEVEEIERIRQKRAFEAALPPMTDEASFAVRKRMMEEQELREWEHREGEIDDAHAERLAALQEKLLARDEQRQFVMDQRVEDLRRRRMAERDTAVAKIQKKRIKALRKLGKARVSSETQVDTLTNTNSAAGLAKGQYGRRRKTRDIIGEYADHGSKVYAPLARNGQHADRNRVAYEVDPEDLAQLGTLNTLEATMPDKAVFANTAAPVKSAPKTHAERHQVAIQTHLDAVHETLRATKAGTSAAIGLDGEQLPAWRKPPPRVLRPATPSVDDEDEDEDEEQVNSAVLLVQKLLRGRAVQNMMFEGKERRLGLIKEIRDAEAPPGSEIARAEAEADAERALELHVGAAQDATIGMATGEVVGATLDFLAKELVRQKEQSRVASLVSRAEQLRRTREAEESGRRQAEAAVRGRRDVVYRQLQRVHAQTAETWVDDLMMGAVEDSASTQAGLEAAVTHNPVGGILDGLEEELNSQEVVVRDLVASFLMPQVERTRVQDQISQEQAKFEHAARKELDVAMGTAAAANKQ
jgi:hypothetical protein